MTLLDDEMNEMAKALEDPEPGVEDSKEDLPEIEEAEETETEETEVETTETEAETETETETETTETEETEEEETLDEDPRDKEIRELRERILELDIPKPAEEPPPVVEEPIVEEPIPEEDFLGETDLDELTRDPKLFNTLLNKIYAKARTDGRAEVKFGNESVVKAIPDIVKNNIALTATLKKVNEDFYAENEDLVPWKKAVATVFEEKMSENPGKSYGEILPDVAKEVRTRLSLHKKAVTDNKPPKLPSKKGGKR